uniref:Secreted protein n=1 Tax=Arundo donax TaxID=35708 RepID=A0A0A9BSN2_ARUDO
MSKLGSCFLLHKLFAVVSHHQLKDWHLCCWLCLKQQGNGLMERNTPEFHQHSGHFSTSAQWASFKRASLCSKYLGIRLRARSSKN